ncbi:MAG: UDP-N-acetylmuramoyl-L-alanine--D-glutamate ligase [Pseudomonadales bacterium]
MNRSSLPPQKLEADAFYAIVGLGATGLSCARFLAAKGASFVLLDSRQQPPNIEQALREFEGVDILLGELSAAVLLSADYLIVSPGVALTETAIALALEGNVELLSDLDLFCASTTAPLVCITGSNGKSTVATLLHKMAQDCGVASVLCGNIGLPVLQALSDQAELYVVEVSSFQLERSRPLTSVASTVLNVSADHMDRYVDFESYQAAKLRVYLASQVCVYNRDDKFTFPASSQNNISFGASPTATSVSTASTFAAANDEFGVADVDGTSWLYARSSALIATKLIRIKGSHNIQNSLAALALAEAANLDLSICCETLKTFSGLEHRCEFVDTLQGIEFINDSKGTNTGATLAAIKGLGGVGTKNIVLIAGGVGKGADFTVLRDAVDSSVTAAVVYGEDGSSIKSALVGLVPIFEVDSLEKAVQRAYEYARLGDTVLFSPACASFDMFTSFEERGDVFKICVGQLSAKEIGQ